MAIPTWATYQPATSIGRIHKTLRVTPAMEAGKADHVWTLEEIAGLVKDEPPKKRGPYKTKSKLASTAISHRDTTQFYSLLTK